MRKLVLVLFVVPAFLAACGGSDPKTNPTPLAGKVGGRAFTPADVKAIQVGSGQVPCDVPLGGVTVTVGVKAVALQLTSYADACGDFATAQCRFHRGGQSVTVVIARLNGAGTSEPALPPGTYTVFQSPTQVTAPDANNVLTAAFAQALDVTPDPVCVGTTSLTVQGGTVRLDQITAQQVTGSLNLRFQDGGSLAGDFTAPACQGISPSVCTLAASNGALCTLPAACVGP